MTSRQFMKLFCLRPAFYAAKFAQPNNIHKKMLAHYRDHINYDDAATAFNSVLAQYGSDRSRMFYIEKVYETIMARKSETHRSRDFAPSIASIMAQAGKGK